MKERRTFICKVKQVNEQHMNTIEAIILVVIVLFIASFLVSWKLFHKPLSTNQFEACEQVARDVYAQAQKGTSIFEVPEDYSVSIDSTTINVRLANYRGKVIAKLQKGELEMTQDREIGSAILDSIVMGLIFILYPLMIMVLILEVVEMVNE